MADEEDIAALVIDNGSGMCKGKLLQRNERDFQFETIASIEREGERYSRIRHCKTQP